jgi:hypothetical protein
MLRRPYAAGVAVLVTFLLSTAVGVIYVNVDGTSSESAPPSSPVPTDAGYSVSPGNPPGYSATATATSVGPGSKRAVGYLTPWVAVGRGWVPMACSTGLSGYQIPANNRKLDSVFTWVRDIGAVRITSPTGAILPGPVIPAAEVHNWGNERETCKVFFRINASPAYLDSVVLPAGLPYADTNLHFTWWPAVGGAYTARCSTALPGDLNPANDTCSARFVVGTIDAAVTAILAPTGSFDTSVLQIPKAKAKNYGTAPAIGVKAVFSIDSTPGNRVYTDTLTVDIGSGVELTLTFDTWPKPYRAGSYLTMCRVIAPGDGNPANDSLTGTFLVLPTGIEETGRLPGVFALDRPLPTPFTGTTTIRFSIPRPTSTNISIYSAAGTHVRVLSAPQPLTPGVYSLKWDGRDDRGATVSRGVYYCRMTAGDFRAMKKLVKLD